MMRRHPALQPLSDDHHSALVLARRLRLSESQSDRCSLADLSQEVQIILEMKLDPHFRVEETWLLPPLMAKGGDRLVERVFDDHARLRDLIVSTWSEISPYRIGKLLEKHVRFEERELFPMAERVLSEFEIAAIRDATVELEERKSRIP